MKKELHRHLNPNGVPNNIPEQINTLKNQVSSSYKTIPLKAGYTPQIQNKLFRIGENKIKQYLESNPIDRLSGGRIMNKYKERFLPNGQFMGNLKTILEKRKGLK